MTIAIGERFPDVTLKTCGSEGPGDLSTGAFLAGRKVVLFALPGAFTPGCSNTHMPGFVVNADRILAKGVDAIACLAVNDAFVLCAWQKDQNAQAITMLADGNGDFAEALGLTMDGSAFGLGKRGQRFSMVVNDGTVEQLHVEGPGEFKVSSAEYMLEQL